MGSASIGIKLADSKFFPVLEEGAPTSKILDLTTVRDDQGSVQINLFRSEADSMEEAEYVGTLIIEDIAEKPAGEPTIELTLSIDAFNELSAEAVDLDSGSRQVLTVSLETLDKETLYNLPDFDLTTIESGVDFGFDPDHNNLAMDETIPGNAPEGLYEMTEEKKAGVFMPAWLCVLILVIGVAALVLALLVAARVMLFSPSGKETAPVAIEAPAVPVVESAPVASPVPEPKTPPPVASSAPSPAVEVKTEPVVPVQPEPAVEAKDIRYKIKWGDTLWDLSESYYKNPWLYPKIAKANNIKNPNLIIAGTYITIPAR